MFMDLLIVQLDGIKIVVCTVVRLVSRCQVHFAPESTLFATQGSGTFGEIWTCLEVQTWISLDLCKKINNFGHLWNVGRQWKANAQPE